VGEPLELQQVAEHAQDLPAGTRLARRRDRARVALPAALEVHVGARGLGEGAHRQQHVGVTQQLFAGVRGDGDHAGRSGERGLGGDRIGEVVARLDGADQQIGALRRTQHRERIEPGVFAALRQDARERGTGGVAALRQRAERRAREARDLGGERAEVGVSRMTQRHRAQPHGAVRAGAERTGRGALGVARGQACDQR
jgi:hypothetical protein